MWAAPALETYILTPIRRQHDIHVCISPQLITTTGKLTRASGILFRAGKHHTSTQKVGNDLVGVLVICISSQKALSVPLFRVISHQLHKLNNFTQILFKMKCFAVLLSVLVGVNALPLNTTAVRQSPLASNLSPRTKQNQANNTTTSIVNKIEAVGSKANSTLLDVVPYPVYHVRLP